jgi:hypothetical protein
MPRAAKFLCQRGATIPEVAQGGASGKLGVVCLAIGMGGRRGPAFDFVVVRNAHFTRLFLLFRRPKPGLGHQT